MLRDCNTCRFHQQGEHPAKVVISDDFEEPKLTCADCLDAGLKHWAPKAGVQPIRFVTVSGGASGGIGGSYLAEELERKLAEKRGAERDPNGLAAKAPGSKLDADKAPVVRGCIKYFPRAIAAVSMLSKHGADKYCWNGWEKVDDGINRYEDAIGRHMIGEAIEGEFDSTWKRDFDKDVLHATAVAWNAMARLELILRSKENPAQ